MAWLKLPHPPAGATTLIVSLGLLKDPAQFGVLMLGVLLLVLMASPSTGLPESTTHSGRPDSRADDEPHPSGREFGFFGPLMNGPF